MLTEKKPADSQLAAKQKYTNFIRKDQVLALLKNDDEYDVRDLQKREFNKYLSMDDRRNIEVTENYAKLMEYRQQKIDDQFKPIDIYFEQQRSKFDTNDIDLIDKAERYYHEAISGNNAKSMAKYETSEEIQKLIEFVDWAKRRGGNAMAEAGIKKDTQEEIEMKKPFWERTYIVGKRQFRFDRNFINDYMKRADVLIRDNENAYHDYKKRALFPKIADNISRNRKDSVTEELGFIESREKEIKDLYKTFVSICKQMRKESQTTQ